MSDAHTTMTFPALREAQISGDLVQTVNARDLHAALGAKKDFSNWIKDRIAGFGFRENGDFVRSPILASEGRGGQNRLDYHLTIDMAKELAMVERNEAGKRVRQYFIECERKLRDGGSAKTATPPDMRDPRQLAGVALQLIDINKDLLAYKEMAEPKVNFYDRVADTEKLLGLRQAARVLGIRPEVFIKALEVDHLFREGGTLVPYSKHLQTGLFKVRMLTDENGRVLVRTFVTPHGLKHLSLSFGRGPIIEHMPEGDRSALGKPAVVGTAILNLCARPEGASLQELCAISGMKEQSALGRISKLRKHQGFNIVREKKDGRFYLRPRANAN